jgi:hypothetical protein
MQMNDQELDEMLDRWEAPPMRDSVRENLRIRFAATAKRADKAAFARRMIAAAAQLPLRRLAFGTVSAAVVLFALIQVFPQTIGMAPPGFRIPFYVESEFVRYTDAGVAGRPSRITSFPYAGHDVIMSVWTTGDSLLDALRGIAGSVQTKFVLAIPSVVLPKQAPMPEPAGFAGFVRSGCAEGKTVVGHETVAGYETVIVQSEAAGRRTRIWMSPALRCFALKLTDEVEQPDGSYRLRLRKETLKVTMTP